MKAKKTKNRIYIVICNGVDVNDPYYIDSVWTSERKAEKRAEELNSKKMDEWRNDCGFLNFEVLMHVIVK